MDDKRALGIRAWLAAALCLTLSVDAQSATRPDNWAPQTGPTRWSARPPSTQLASGAAACDASCLGDILYL